MRLEQYITESINDKGIFKAIFMAGSPGSGKSFVRKKLSGGYEPRVVNTDKFTEFFGGWNGFSEKIKLLNNNQLLLYLNSMLPLWIDGTSGNRNNLMTREGLLSGMGYDTGMIWVNTDLDEAVKRAQEREAHGGRHVDIPWLKETYEKIQKMKSFYMTRFQWFLEVDNNTGQLTDEVVQNLYSKTLPFFGGPVKNPHGQEIINTLKEMGGKYLTDMEEYDMKFIQNRTKAWFT